MSSHVARAIRLGVSLTLTLGVLLVSAQKLLAQEAAPKFTADRQARLDEANKLTEQVVDLSGKGQFQAALELAKRALTIRQEVLGPSHPQTAQSLNNLGFLMNAIGNPQAARPYYEQALAIRKNAFGLNHADTATSLNNLGALLQTLGDYAAARPLLEQALAIRKEVLGLKHPSTATTLNNVAALLDTMGDYEAAKPYYEQSLAIRLEVSGPKHSATAAAYNNLGFVLREMGQLDEAKDNYEKALAIRQETLGPKHPDTADSLNNLAFVLRAAGDFDKAKQYFEQSLAINREVYGDKHLSTARSLNNLGNLHQTSGDFVGAKPYYQQALAIRKDLFGLVHPATISAFDNLAALSAAMDDWAAAAEFEASARHGVREHVAAVLPALSEKQQLQFIDTQDLGMLYGALSLGLHANKHQPLAELSAEFLANGKAVIQESLAESAQLAAASSDQQLKPLIAQLKDVRQQLAKLAQITPEPDEIAAHRQDLDRLEKQQRELADRVSGQLRRPNRSRWVTLESIRRGIPRGGLLVDIARVEPYDFKAIKNAEPFQSARYIAWLTPDRGDVAVVDLGDAEKIDAAVAAFQAAFAPCQSPDKTRNPLVASGEAVAEKQLRSSLANLGKQILEPLASHLSDRTQIVLSPDGALWLIPWAALPVPGDAEKYAVEKWTIRYVTSARELAIQRDKPSANPARLFANPNYNLPATDVAKALASAAQGATKPAGSEPLANDFRSRSLGAIGRVALLPATAQEAAAIAPSIKKLLNSEPRTFSDDRALEGVFKQSQAPRVLVLSTHGFFLPDQAVKRDDAARSSRADDINSTKVAVDQAGNPLENPLLRCGLLLAGCNNRDKLPANSNLDDGILTGMEIVGTNLRGTELVVLSACETGIGKVNNGEGVAGLRQAFQLAGAQSVVATLWQIPDQATAQLMNDFFGNLAAGQSKAEALRNAQLARIKARREKFGAAHPLFWAAFTLTGT